MQQCSMNPGLTCVRQLSFDWDPFSRRLLLELPVASFCTPIPRPPPHAQHLLRTAFIYSLVFCTACVPEPLRVVLQFKHYTSSSPPLHPSYPPPPPLFSSFFLSSTILSSSSSSSSTSSYPSSSCSSSSSLSSSCSSLVLESAYN